MIVTVTPLELGRSERIDLGEPCRGRRLPKREVGLDVVETSVNKEEDSDEN
ncbi:MAG: hypothetical protein ACRDRL_32925 [Sciscionella sp.]